MKPLLTSEQKDDLSYFWKEKRDLERYCYFEELKPQIKEELPALLKAWEDYKAIIQTLNIITDAL